MKYLMLFGVLQLLH